MNFELSFLFSYSILLTGLVAFICFSNIPKPYYPFIFLIWIGCINEMLSHWLLTHNRNNIINSNIYSLIESICFLWFFKNLRTFDKMKVLFHTLLILFCVSWIFESFILHTFGTGFNSYFTVIYSFPLVILSIHTINTILLTENEILRNSKFLIAIGIIVYFTYSVITEVFWFYGHKISAAFFTKVYAIMIWINMVTNFVYALAILWMKKRQAFTLRY